MATDTRSPTSGLSILREGSFLKKKTTVWMKDPEMYGSMKQTSCMDLGSGSRPDDAIIVVDDIKDLFGWIHKGRAIEWGRVPRPEGRGLREVILSAFSFFEKTPF